ELLVRGGGVQAGRLVEGLRVQPRQPAADVAGDPVPGARVDPAGAGGGGDRRTQRVAVLGDLAAVAGPAVAAARQAVDHRVGGVVHDRRRAGGQPAPREVEDLLLGDG